MIGPLRKISFLISIPFNRIQAHCASGTLPFHAQRFRLLRISLCNFYLGRGLFIASNCRPDQQVSNVIHPNETNMKRCVGRVLNVMA
jgi:hypothetical protein